MDLMREVYQVKKSRGDTDAAQFRDVARYWLGNKLNATISGARWTISRLLENGKNEIDAAKMRAFLKDLEGL